jgi:hypothetical protein
MWADGNAKKGRKKKTYSSPKIFDFGNIEDITKGNLSDITDADFAGGSGGA